MVPNKTRQGMGHKYHTSVRNGKAAITKRKAATKMTQDTKKKQKQIKFIADMIVWLGMWVNSTYRKKERKKERIINVHNKTKKSKEFMKK